MADFGAQPQKNYGIVPCWVMKLTDVKPGPKALYASLCTNADTQGRLWRSLDRLAIEFDVTRRQVMRWINDLEASGLLVRFTLPRKIFLVIRDPDGRDWARKTNLVSVANRRAVFAKLGKEGANKRWHCATPKSQSADKNVQAPATPMSPKHNLLNKPILTEEKALQERVGGANGAPKGRLHGLRRLNSSPHAEAAQEALNRLGAEIGWDAVWALQTQQRLAARLVADNPGVLSEADALSVVSLHNG
jgi:hypothetical protein